MSRYGKNSSRVKTSPKNPRQWRRDYMRLGDAESKSIGAQKMRIWTHNIVESKQANIHRSKRAKIINHINNQPIRTRVTTNTTAKSGQTKKRMQKAPQQLQKAQQIIKDFVTLYQQLMRNHHKKD
jgi:hypothetical protein